MRIATQAYPGAISLFLLFFTYASGDVKISEFGAVSSDRLLRWSDSGMPTLGSGIPWWEAGFDDTAWPNGTAPIGFNYPEVVTDLANQVFGLTPSLYVRQKFTVTAGQAASTEDLLLDIDYDDGFIVYLNGKEVARANMAAPGGFVYADQPSFNAHNWTGNETFTLGRIDELLQEGENIIAIQIHNVSLTSGAMFLDAGLKKTAGGTVNFLTKGSDWHYFIGRVEPSGGVFDPAFLPDQEAFEPDWAKVGFFLNDEWKDGNGPLGFDASADYPLGTDLDAMRNNQSVLYTRKEFLLDPSLLASISTITLTVDFDDGFVAYLNGKEIARENLGGPGLFVPFDATANANHNASMDSGGNVPSLIQSFSVDKSLLNEGTNVLAIQMCNNALNSSDLMVISDLTTNGGSGPQLVNSTDLHKYFIGTDEPATVEDNSDIAVDPKFVDWIELHNDGAQAVNLTGWSLTDDEDEPRKWVFPNGTSIDAGGYLLVLADGIEPENVATTFLHANFKLSANGEFLGLYNESSEAQTEFASEYPKQYDFHSYGTNPGGSGYGYLSQATPGAANAGPFLSDRAKSPDFSREGGFYDSTISITLSSTTPGATVRYTTDGSEPTATNGQNASTSLFLTPIDDKTGHVIRARSFAPGMIPSKVKTHTYLIAQHPNLQTAPALIFTGEEARTFFKEHGIMAIEGGTYVNNRWQADGIDSYNIPINRGRAYERPIHLEMYYADGREGVRETVGLRLSSSNYSRPRLRLTNTDASPWTSNHTEKPSFNIFCRSDYGTEAIEHQWLEEDYSVDQFAQFRVRAGKNDMRSPFVADQVVRNLFSDMGQVSSRGINNTVYINGEFKGFFNLSERLREPFFQEHHDSKEEWDVRQVGEFASGDSAKWNEMIALMQQDLTVLANYEAVLGMLDVDNFIDYLLVNTYGATRDWPQNNWVAARERSDTGLYRFYVWDAEMSYGFGNRATSYDTIQADLINKNNDIPRIFKYLRVSPEFRLRWADRVQKHFFHEGVLDDRDAPNSNARKHWIELVATHQPLLSYVHNQTVDSTRFINWTSPSNGKRSYLFGPNATQFANHGLWPDLKAPEFSQHGGEVPGGYLLQISQTGPPGSTIYTTTDGSDPRLPGGAISPNATAYNNGMALYNASSQVMARVYVPSTGEWSPLNEAVFEVGIPPVLINEILTHTDLPEVDSIELYNPNPVSVNLRGWFLTDNQSNPKKFTIPNGTVIPPGGYLVFDESDFNAGGANSFRLSEYGEEVYLFSGNIFGDLTGYSHGWDFRAAPNGVTMGRHVDSQGKVHFVLQESNTLGSENSDPLVGPVAITEIHYHPTDLNGGVDNPADEFIELSNISTSPVPLYNTNTSVPGYGNAALSDTWQLRNAVDFDFPPGVTMQPGDRFLVVGFDPDTDTAQLASLRSKFNIHGSVQVFGPWSGKLDNSGEEIEWKYPGNADPDASFFVPYYTIEEIDYRDAAPWPIEADGAGSSLQRIRFDEFANDPANWKADIPQTGSGRDTDNDLMDDWWELLHGLNVGIDDSGSDLDLDRFNNLDEFLAGTLPGDPRSYLHLEIEPTQVGLNLGFTALPHVSYTIQYSDSLISPNWIDLQEIAPDSEEREIQISITPTEDQRFFRAIVSPLD
ncbi:MAG: lamin tail domain-containing protein [Verrucomicrobiales bacterium]|nr:lamin tail domain-containing protein [Verrucomicrobiales bacterium]